MRSAPMLKSWMMPFSSVAMIEKLALVRIAFCSAPALSNVVSRMVASSIRVPCMAVCALDHTPQRIIVVDLDDRRQDGEHAALTLCRASRRARPLRAQLQQRARTLAQRFSRIV